MTRPALQLGLALAVLAAWSVVDGAGVRAEYVPIVGPSSIGDAPSVFAAAGMDSVGERGCPPAFACTSTWEPAAPSLPMDAPPPPVLLRFPCGPQAGGCGAAPPPPSSGPGSAVPAAASLNKPEIPRDDRGCRLAAETNSWELPSFPSRLFRPPRRHA